MLSTRDLPMPKAAVKPLLVAAGASFALVGCTTTASPGSRPIRFVTVQPIQVCDDFGLICADLATFAESTFKIWQQADIEVSFLPPNRLLGSRFLTIDSRDEFAELAFAGGPGSYGRNPSSRRTSGPINMWFVDQILQGPFEVFGLAWVDANGVLISDNILGFNNGRGRIDTVAHEIGHNLGLTHSNLGSGSANNLMTDGRDRAVPTTLNDINPDGARLSRLTDDQVGRARSSPLVSSSPTPTPRVVPIDPFPIILPLLEDSDFDAVPMALTSSPPPRVEAFAAPVKAPGELDDGMLLAAQFAPSPAAQAVPEPLGLSWLGGGVLAWFFWRKQQQ
ncbi:MAG: hypothetical protein ICV62_17300 [Cyanobacteria bacterium Co-bin13]|nr:hypothetical protein [Cyanobacteria bacterium Co-bin13]